MSYEIAIYRRFNAETGVTSGYVLGTAAGASGHCYEHDIERVEFDSLPEPLASLGLGALEEFCFTTICDALDTKGNGWREDCPELWGHRYLKDRWECQVYTKGATDALFLLPS